MILIISESNDLSTMKVVNWLISFNAKYLILNENDVLDEFYISINSNVINDNNGIEFYASFKNKSFKLSDIKAFWYRRGMISKFIPHLYGESLKYLKEQHLYNEWSRLQLLIHKLIEGKPGIGSFENTIHFNKTYQLFIAKEVGLSIPTTLISNSKEKVLNFFHENNLCITKNIERELNISHLSKYIWTTGTHLIGKENIELLDSKYFYSPSLIQQAIKKKYEIRTFYLEPNFFSMCIFSHDNSNTSSNRIDYRSSETQLRMIPYTLPLEITAKLTLLMKKLKLNSGSIDILVSESNEFIFLEVNPVGQYDFLSVKCNYNLDKEIALYLINTQKSNEVH